MKLSIVTITFNNYDELKKTLESVPHSPELEVVVINGGQCEKTRNYLQEHPEFRSLSEPDRGIADAFNKGYKLAQGEYILFLNSGDYLVDARYVKWLENADHADFYYGAILFDDFEYGRIPIYPHGKNIGWGMPYPHQTLAVRREVFERIGGFSLEYKVGMDYDFVCRMLKAGFKGLEYKEAPIVLMDGSGISRTREVLCLREYFQALRSSGLLWEPPIFCAYLFRWVRVLTRLGIQKLGLRWIVHKVKMMKAKRSK